MSGRNGQKSLEPFLDYACHPCAGAMLIFSVSFHFYHVPEGKLSEFQAVYKAAALTSSPQRERPET